MNELPSSRIGCGAAGGLAALLLACAPAERARRDEPGCRSSADCSPTQICYLGTCATPCNVQADCADGYLCSAGVCQRQSTDEASAAGDGGPDAEGPAGADGLSGDDAHGGEPAAGDPAPADETPPADAGGDHGPLPTFFLALDEAALHLPRTTSRGLGFTVTRTAGFDDAVTVTALGLPAGVSTPGTSVPGNESSGVLVLSADAAAPISTASAVIQATTSDVTRQEPLTLFVDGAPGAIDASFGASGQVTTPLVDAAVRALAVQPDGKIVAAGHASGDFALVRYTAAGALDPTFGGDGIVTLDQGGADIIRGMRLTGDGSLVVVGTGGSGTTQRLTVARFLADGTLDPAFGTAGVAIANAPAGVGNGLTLQTDGKVVAVGASANNVLVARFTAGGEPDSTFAGDGTVVENLGATDWASGVVVTGTGEIVAGGFTGVANAYDCIVLRYLGDGTLDATFGVSGLLTFDGSGGGLSDYVDNLFLLGDGRVLIQGNANTPDSDFTVARLLRTGELDPAYGTAGLTHIDFEGGDDDAGGAALDGDGRLVLVGSVETTGGDDVGVARFTAGGFLDPTFDGDGRMTLRFDLFDIHDVAIAIQTDGRILVGGSSISAGAPRFILARLWP